MQNEIVIVVLPVSVVRKRQAEFFAGFASIAFQGRILFTADVR